MYVLCIAILIPLANAFLITSNGDPWTQLNASTGLAKSLCQSFIFFLGFIHLKSMDEYSR